MDWEEVWPLVKTGWGTSKFFWVNTFSGLRKVLHKTKDWVQSKINYLVGPQEPLLATGMSRTTTASPKPFFRAPRRVGDAMVSRTKKAWWTTSKSGCPCLCQNCSRGPSTEKTGSGSLLNPPAYPPPPPMTQLVKELCWVNTCADWSVAVSPLCVQHTLRLFCLLKIPCPPFSEV